MLTRTHDWKKMDDNEFSAYLASECSSSDESGSDDEAKELSHESSKLKKLKNRYRKALLGSDFEDDDDESGSGTDAADESEEGGMEMTFTPAANDILKSKKMRDLEASETPYERYLREKKQKKNQKLHDKRTKQKQMEREQKEILKKSKGKGASLALRNAVGASSGEESDEGGRNFDMRKIERKEKVETKKLRGKRKAKEMKKLKSASGLQEGFAFDVEDPRFAALYSKGGQFALDPTDPKFKKSKATESIFQERRKKIEKHQDGAVVSTADVVGGAEQPSSSDKSLQAMVENIKRKAKSDGAVRQTKKFKMNK